MSNFENRIGHDNFVWWMGVVEDVEDELNLGRVRCRIFGVHTEDLSLVPTKDLPWALPMLPTNNSNSFSAPTKGSYCMGYFADGMAKQTPVIMGVFPGIPQAYDRASVGFSSRAEYTNSTKTEAEHIGKMPASVAVDPAVRTSPDSNSTEIKTVTAPGMAKIIPGKPTTPANAYTANNTILNISNSDTVHACDFKFLINIPDLTIGVIEDPIALIKKAIADSKNRAAAIMQAFIAWAADQLRVTINGVIATLNLDPTGQLAVAISSAKAIVRKINAKLRLIAEYVGNIALVVYLIKDLQMVIDWIKSLPAKVLAMLKDCLGTFTKALNDAVGQVASIPGQIENGLLGVFSHLQSSTESTVAAIQGATATANVPNTLISIVTSPTIKDVDVLNDYYFVHYPNTEITMSENTTSTFNVENISTP